jgi:DNA-binding NarL/FixJ family response regulator
MSANFREERAGLPPGGGANLASDELTCLVQSNHPVVVRLINNALASDPLLKATIKSYSTSCRPVENAKLQLLILDTCSVGNWAACLERWRAEGGITIALVSSEPLDMNLALKLLHLGASGILRSTDNLAHELPRAVHAVAGGHLWIRREVLDLYVKRTRALLHNISASEQRLTTREKQILRLLQGGLRNRVIAQRFGVSQRTIKFHVSNILRKLNLKSRKELQTVDYTENVLLFGSSSHVLEARGANVPDFNPFQKTG